MATEKAQILGLGVDADSVIGRQKALYSAQTSGYSRDAEQKATKIMMDHWAVKRTTNEGEPSPINDSNITAAANKLLAGIGT